MNAVFLKAEKAQAQAEVRSIMSAIQAYNNEYGKLPVQPTMQGNNDNSAGDVYSEAISKAVIKALNGIHDTASGGAVPNPRKIPFLDSQGSSVDGTFKDPWDKQYLMKMDTDYNNTITYTNGTFTTVGVVVSYGPDGTHKTSDDIISF
jgi:hypothetical protein